MVSTQAWAESLGISGAFIVPEIADYNDVWPITARQIAIRTIILQGVVAVAFGVEAQSIIDWFQEQQIWDEVSPNEKVFLLSEPQPDEVRVPFQWHQEAQWALLWMIGKVDRLGLPTAYCDSRRLVDELMPGLGTDIEPFLDSVQIRSPGTLLAEDDRTYNLWCYVAAAWRKKEPLPDDLIWKVLYERRYAFEWIDGIDTWDNVTCDA